MKTSTILKRAEKYLWHGNGSRDNRASRLCHALQRASRGRGKQGRQTCKLAQATIMQALGGHNTYSQWAVYSGYLPEDWIDSRDQWYPLLQANRLNWLRELQRQFKAKGD